MKQKKVKKKLSGRQGEIIIIDYVDGSQDRVQFVDFNADLSNIEIRLPPDSWSSFQEPPKPFEPELKCIKDIRTEDDIEREQEEKEQVAKDYWWDRHYYRDF